MRAFVEVLTDPELFEVVTATLLVSVSATIVGLVVGAPLGVGLELGGFRGRSVVETAIGIWTVVPAILVGSAAFALVVDTGLDISFTTTTVAQICLGTPIAVGLTARAIGGLPAAALEQLDALQLGCAPRVRVALAEVWPEIVGVGVSTVANVLGPAGAALIAGGRIGGGLVLVMISLVLILIRMWSN